MPTLVLYYPPKKKRWNVEVQGQQFLIGRNREADVCIPHSSVSKRHVLIEKRAAGYVYKDLGSKNGVFLNGFRLDQGLSDDGDELRVGNLVITFFVAKPPAPSPAPTQPALQGGEPAPALSIADLEESEEPNSESTKGSTIRIPIEKVPRSVDRPDPPGNPPDAPRRLSATAIGLGAAGCVALGLLLGYLGGRADSDREQQSPAAGATSFRGSEAPRGEPPSPAVRAPLGPPARFDDAETVRRLCVRLYLDLVGRPPLRRELKAAVSLSPEMLWDEISSKAPPAPDPPPERLGETFERLMGRKPESEENAKLREAAHDDPAHYAFEIGMSSDYSSAGHRRKRSETQLARSLLVDLTGVSPGQDIEKKTLEAVKLAKENIRSVAKAIADAAGAGELGQQPDETPEEWVRDAYARLLLRFPTDSEAKSAASRVKQEKQGWRSVLLDLASSQEYLRY